MQNFDIDFEIWIFFINFVLQKYPKWTGSGTTQEPGFDYFLEPGTRFCSL